MGILDDLTKNLGGARDQGGPGGVQQGALVQALMGLLAGGGLQQLISSFQQKGLGDAVSSWISTGPNQPVSPEQVGQALGPERLGDLSRQTGIDAGALPAQLAALLPTLVDRLTPDGSVPDASSLQARLGGALKGLF